MSASQEEIPPPPLPPPSSSQTPSQQTPYTISTIKLPILKKGEYDIWAMKMEHYLAHTDYPIWEVIQNRNGPVSITTDTSRQIKVLPPRTAEEIIAQERERKSRTALLMALPEDHLTKFHKMTDAKEMWDAIKSRFGGNDESKKMQKYILKQQFEGFSVSNTEGLHKGYDRFQSLLSQLEIHGAGVSTEDANQIFLRSLPFACIGDNRWEKVRIGHSSEDEDYALLACNSSDSTQSIEIKAYSQGLKKVEAQLVAHQQGQLWYEQKIKFMKIDLDDKTDVLTYHKKLLAEALKEKEDLKAKSVFMNKESELENQPLNDRFPEGMHVVPPPMTGNYMPSGPEIEVDYSQFTYGPKQTQPSESESQSSEFDTCKSNISTKPSELMSELVVNKPNVECQTKVWSDAPIIKEYESDSEDDHNHLIRDYDFHEKRMTRKAELNNGWNNVQRVNKQNQFVPSGVLTRTSKIPISTTRASSTKFFSTAKQSFNKQTIQTNTVMKVNIVKLIVNRVRLANVFYKTHSPSSRPFKKTIVLRLKFSNQKLNTAKVNAVSTVGGKRETTVKPSDYPHRALKNKGIVDSGCSRHMTGNKAYLAEFQDFNGGPVALLLEVVKKNKVLFTDTECLVLSPDFKLPNEN
ncbi:hypothetical protein Tco_0052726 [Tanacetum coccineum]